MRREDRRAECPELSGEALERHLFACARCRGQARLAAAWKALGQTDAEGETASDAFVARVLAGAAAGRRRDRVRRTLAVAAAVLLFFFCAGTGHRSAGATDADAPAEDAYASLTAPSVLDAVLPE